MRNELFFHQLERQVHRGVSDDGNQRGNIIQVKATIIL